MPSERPGPRTAAEPLLLELLTVAQRQVGRGLAPVLAEEGCTVEQWRVLRALGDRQGHPMGELAESLQIPHASLTRVVDGLVDSSDVYRRQSRLDRRRVTGHLSRRGQDRLARLDSLALAHERAMRAVLDDDAVHDLRTQLGLLGGSAG